MRISDWSSDVCSSDLQACVDCHNIHLAGHPPLQLGDVLGAFVIDVPAEGFLAQARRDAAAAAALIFLVLATVSGVILFLQHRRQEAESRAVASAERSEEHTSELQSLMRISYAVFCLKKKNKPE